MHSTACPIIKRLLVKMANYGIIGKTFLVRSQAKSGDKLREVSMEKVISGVPQGSVIYIGLIPCSCCS